MLNIIKGMISYCSKTFLFASLSLTYIISHINYNSNLNDNDNNTRINVEKNIDEQTIGYFELYDEFEEDLDDETAKNSVINTWRKDYFDFLEKKNHDYQK